MQYLFICFDGNGYNPMIKYKLNNMQEYKQVFLLSNYFCNSKELYDVIMTLRATIESYDNKRGISMRINYDSLKEEKKHETEEISNKRKVLEEDIDLIIYGYQTQTKSIPKRIGYLREKVYGAIVATSIVVILDLILYFYMTMPAGTLLAYTVEFWVACIFIYGILVASIYSLVGRIYDYHTNKETSAFMKFKLKHGIFTLKDEERFCFKKIKELKGVLEEIKTRTELEDIKENYQIEYIEKRADNIIMNCFDEKRIRHLVLINIVLIIIYSLLIAALFIRY